MHKHAVGKTFQDAVRHTQECESICVATIQHCLELGGEHTEPSHLQLMQDCADICETTAKFLARSSPQHAQVTTACADLCDRCAASCEQFVGDAPMKACADECRLCADACRRIAPKAMGGG
jgi:hypothetical protein